MLDTIILQILINYSSIINHEKFGPSTKKILDNQQGFSKYINNPTKIDKEKGIYKPRLTIIKRGKAIYLKVEFSAPKLLFGNNLDELSENDFDEAVSKLRKIIKEMGVMLWTNEIENAEIISFHPSKNIPLSKGYTSSFAIRELSKINLNQKLDLEKVSFRNNGELLQFYANRHSFVLYDKINDLSKPVKRGIDKDQTKQQTLLFDYIQREKKNLEILRFEIRMSHKTKMKEILTEIGFTENPVFKNIFKEDICQKILKLYWNKFFQKDNFLFCISNNPQRLLQMILQKYPRTKPKTAVLLVGLNLLCKDDEGIRGLRTIINSKNWTPLRNYLRKFKNDIFKHPQHEFIKDIEENLKDFKPFKLDKEKKLSTCLVKNSKVS